MHPVLVLFRKSALIFLHHKGALAITFAVPICLIYLFGYVFGLYPGRKPPGPTRITLAVINASPEPAARELVAALGREPAFRILTETRGADGTTRPITEADARAAIRDNQYRFALILPSDLLPEDRIGIHVKFLSDPRNTLEAQTVNGLLQRTIFTQVPQLLGQSLQQRARALLGGSELQAFHRTLAEVITRHFGGDPAALLARLERGDFGFGALLGADRSDGGIPSTPDGPAAGRGASTPHESVLSRIVQIDSEQLVGKAVSNPMAARMVGGYAVMFLLFALTGTATSLFAEKRSGIFQRILAAPVKPAHLLWSRFLFGITLGVCQLAVLFLAGKLLYGLDVFTHALALLVLVLATAAACTAFGLLIAAVTSSEEAANGLATLLVLTMSSVGGAWFPVTFLPEIIQQISKLTIVYWAVEGFSAVLWAERPVLEILPYAGILAGTAVVVMAIATWAFRRNRMFD